MLINISQLNFYTNITHPNPLMEREGTKEKKIIYFLQISPSLEREGVRG